ncbi:hypothetical protein ACFSOZ_02255 [Mesorhizobium newzealandense]|uniref:Uncharacterized protein n=1 Tax=Mesorhizobium newzealandense TaxID=1300302 RepID=A0ABW4U5L7_9HYPH
MIFRAKQMGRNVLRDAHLELAKECVRIIFPQGAVELSRQPHGFEFQS